MRLTVGLTYNLKRAPDPAEAADAQAEFDAPETIDALRAALEPEHAVVPVEADADAYDKLRDARPDVVFNVAEGAGGPFRESFIPAVLDHLQIPYTGSDPLALATCLHKARTKEVLLSHAIPTAPFRVYNRPPETDPRFRYPAIVKPLHEGSSMGIRSASVVHSLAELRAEVDRVVADYRQSALVEKFLPGEEFTAAVLGNGDDVRVLPLVRIRLESLPKNAAQIFGFEAKWIWDTPDNPLEILECPAVVEPGVEAQIRDVVLDAYRVLGCRDWCRIDVRLDDRGAPNVIELNPLPGILPRPEENSCFPRAARAAGLDYKALVLSVLDIACKRVGLVPVSA